MWYLASIRHRSDPRICVSRARVADRSWCCMISHDRTADQPHQLAGCNNFFGQSSFPDENFFFYSIIIYCTHLYFTKARPYLGPSQPVQSLFQDRILSVPQRKTKRQSTLTICDAKQAVLSPAIGSWASMIMREVVPTTKRRERERERERERGEREGERERGGGGGEGEGETHTDSERQREGGGIDRTWSGGKRVRI